MTERLDCRGMSCPKPIIELSRVVRGMPSGATVLVLADDRAFPADVRAWCHRTGNTIVTIATSGGCHTAEVRRGSP